MNRITSIGLLMILLFGIQMDINAQGNKKKGNTKRSLPEQCFTLDELQQLMTMPFYDPEGKGEGFSNILTNRGYVMGMVLQQIDTIFDQDLGYVLIKYSRYPFYDEYNKESYVIVDVADDGDSLTNVVRYRRTPIRNCVISDASFHDLGYAYDEKRDLFALIEPELYTYETYCHNDSNEVVVVMHDVLKINSYVNRKKKEARDYVIDQTMKASMLSDSGQFTAALDVLDILEGWYKPLDYSVRDTKIRITSQFTQYWMKRLSEVVNKIDDVQEAISICDTLLKYSDNKDTIIKMRTILVERREGSTEMYSQFHPEVYKQIINALEDVANNETRENLDTRMQSLEMSFHFNTTINNMSSGSVALSFNDEVRDYDIDSYFSPRTEKLQAKIDSIANLPIIKPVQRDGICILTSESFNTKVDWIYTKYEVQDSCNDKNIKMAPYLKIVDEMFFTGYRSERSKKSRDGATISSKMNYKPTTAKYTFGMNEKTVGDSVYTDVSLLDFKTSGAMSWVPSLLIPGIGSRDQGVISSAASRAVPFFLFGGLAVAGFILENNNANNPGLFSQSNVDIYERKGFGKVVGFTCLSISGIIYINDIVESISATVRNHKSAKKIRNELSTKGPLEIQKQDLKFIISQQTDDGNNQ